METATLEKEDANDDVEEGVGDAATDEDSDCSFDLRSKLGAMRRGGACGGAATVTVGLLGAAANERGEGGRPRAGAETGERGVAGKEEEEAV